MFENRYSYGEQRPLVEKIRKVGSRVLEALSRPNSADRMRALAEGSRNNASTHTYSHVERSEAGIVATLERVNDTVSYVVLTADNELSGYDLVDRDGLSAPSTHELTERDIRATIMAIEQSQRLSTHVPQW